MRFACSPRLAHRVSLTANRLTTSPPHHISASPHRSCFRFSTKYSSLLDKHSLSNLGSEQERISSLKMNNSYGHSGPLPQPYSRAIGSTQSSPYNSNGGDFDDDTTVMSNSTVISDITMETLAQVEQQRERHRSVIEDQRKMEDKRRRGSSGASVGVFEKKMGGRQRFNS